MRVLIHASNFKPQAGGVAEYTHQIAHHLSCRGNYVAVLAPAIDDHSGFDRDSSYHIYRYRQHRPLGGFGARSLYSRLLELVEILDIDILISNHIKSSPHYCWLAAKRTGNAYCILTYAKELRGGYSLKKGLKRYIALRGADKVFAISKFTKSIVEDLGVNPKKIVVVPGGISLKDFKPDNCRISREEIVEEFNLNNRKVVFTLGRLVQRKGFDTVIKAIPRVLASHPNTKYLIGGDGPQYGELRHLAEENDLNEQIRFAGRVNEEERQAFYDACDIFVMPCRELPNGDIEGFGIVFSEANACGKPVIVGKSGGAVDAVVHNETGLLVDPLNVTEVADAINYLLAHPDKARRMGENGRRRVERELTWDKLAEQMEEHLLEIVDRSR